MDRGEALVRSVSHRYRHKEQYKSHAKSFYVLLKKVFLAGRLVRVPLTVQESSASHRCNYLLHCERISVLSQQSQLEYILLFRVKSITSLLDLFLRKVSQDLFHKHLSDSTVKPSTEISR